LFHGAVKAHEKVLSYFLEAESETLEMEPDKRSSAEKSPNILPCGHDHDEGSVCGSKKYSE
jgi:hypothetical protein